MEQHSFEIVSHLELAMFINECKRGVGREPLKDMTVRTYKTYTYREIVFTIFQYLDDVDILHTHLN